MNTLFFLILLYLFGVGITLILIGAIQELQNRTHRYHYYAEVFDSNVLLGRSEGFVYFDSKMTGDQLVQMLFDDWKKTLRPGQFDLTNAVLLIKSLTKL